MAFFLIAILAGLLTVLAPCILPLLPIVVGASQEKNKISQKAIIIIVTLSISVFLFTLLLKATTLFIKLPNNFWSVFSGVILLLVGFFLLFPNWWSKIKFLQKLNSQSNKTLGLGFQKNNNWGNVIIGLSLGPVFTTCSPTYLFIVATILPASFSLGIFYLFGFIIGLATALLLIAFFGQKLINKLIKNNNSEKIKKVFAIIIIVIAIMIIFGLDKKIETTILDSGYSATINFEESLIEKFK